MAKTRAGEIIGSGTPHVPAGLDDRDILLTRPEAAEYLKKSEPTLERWATQGIGPKPLKVGPRTVRYTLRSLREFVGTADAPQAAWPWPRVRTRACGPGARQSGKKTMPRHTPQIAVAIKPATIG